jgi:dTDP-4-dehydrorhamnose 3,5-epimerase
MKVLPTELKEVLFLEPRVFEDARGYFFETYHTTRYQTAGIDCTFVQDNLSYSMRGTLRGLHYQLPNAQAKLVQVLQGEVLDVAVDIRRSSPTFGQWISATLSDINKRQMFIPEGFAHGFCVLSETAIFTYKCSGFYSPEHERGILWSDPQLAIPWPIDAPTLSQKDQQYPLLSQVPTEQLPP